uniref:Uncharacterized protein n=1 Tax=Knipowitschia caucasica TaxID=637954 RepID=A0AAV2LVQ1_KNICA
MESCSRQSQSESSEGPQSSLSLSIRPPRCVREMSAALAEQRVRIQQLQDHNQVSSVLKDSSPESVKASEQPQPVHRPPRCAARDERRVGTERESGSSTLQAHNENLDKYRISFKSYTSEYQNQPSGSTSIGAIASSTVGLSENL